MHMNHERLISVFDEAPEFARDVPKEEWMAERDPDRIAAALTDSAKAVRDAVFLSAWPTTALPAIVLTTAVAVVLAVPIYAKLLSRVRTPLPTG